MSGDVVANAGEQLDSLTMDPKTEPLVEANPPRISCPTPGLPRLMLPLMLLRQRRISRSHEAHR